jgi:glycosyl hydrolase family 18 (putative chitinase)
MKRIPLRSRTALALGLCVPLTVALGAGAAAAAARAAPSAHSGHARSATGLIPRHVYAPYFETWTKDNIAAIARASGARYLTLAFLQTPKKGSCQVAWDGDPGQIVKPGGRYVDQVRELRAMGGDVVPSFGGFSADQGGTEIADSCTSVPQIAKAYENVVTTYGVTRLDMDVEANSLNNKAGIERRSEALALLQKWAARTHRTVQIVFTIGVEPWGLPGNCFAVIKSAAAHGVRFTVNIMAFDYYIKASLTGIEMGTAAVKALNGTHAQLARLFPRRGQRRLWSMEGITILPGIDDYPKKTEVTYLRDARTVASFARSHGMPEISIWAIQRDNGGCPGTIDSNSCSGIKQPTWAFSHVFDGFTG